jgi:hypothetical protein
VQVVAWSRPGWAATKAVDFINVVNKSRMGGGSWQYNIDTSNGHLMFSPAGECKRRMRVRLRSRTRSAVWRCDRRRSKPTMTIRRDHETSKLMHIFVHEANSASQWSYIYNCMGTVASSEHRTQHMWWRTLGTVWIPHEPCFTSRTDRRSTLQHQSIFTSVLSRLPMFEGEMDTDSATLTWPERPRG